MAFEPLTVTAFNKQAIKNMNAKYTPSLTVKIANALGITALIAVAVYLAVQFVVGDKVLVIWGFLFFTIPVMLAWVYAKTGGYQPKWVEDHTPAEAQRLYDEYFNSLTQKQRNAVVINNQLVGAKENLQTLVNNLAFYQSEERRYSALATQDRRDWIETCNGGNIWGDPEHTENSRLCDEMGANAKKTEALIIVARDQVARLQEGLEKALKACK